MSRKLRETCLMRPPPNTLIFRKWTQKSFLRAQNAWIKSWITCNSDSWSFLPQCSPVWHQQLGSHARPCTDDWESVIVREFLAGESLFQQLLRGPESGILLHILIPKFFVRGKSCNKMKEMPMLALPPNAFRVIVKRCESAGMNMWSDVNRQRKSCESVWIGKKKTCESARTADSH